MNCVSAGLLVVLGCGIVIGVIATWLVFFFMEQHLRDLEASAYGGSDD